MSRWSALALLLILGGALALRIPQLSLRPLHNDEAVNAIKVAELWEHGKYKYDPDEYHGPTLHYATALFLSLTGAKNANELPDAALRIAPVVFGVGLILLGLLFRGAIPDAALLWAGLFVAISPAMVFYSRYFIHEMLLVFFAALALAAGWRYSQKASWKWALLAGASVGLMWATKETFVITVLAFGCAGVATWVWLRGRGIHLLTAAATKRHAVVAFGAFGLVWVILFSSFFTNWEGLADSVRTYFPWLKRAGGHSPHIHGWSFYFERLVWFHPAKSPVWSELLIVVLALVGGVLALVRRSSGLQVSLAFYAFAQVCAYTIIPYKTPWCLLNFWHPLILLAGLGAAELASRFRWPACVAMALAAGQLGWQAYRGNFIYFADRKNPYVYAQTVPGLVELARKVESIAKVAEGTNTVVKVVTGDGDYWPLPWYLRRFKTVGWYDTMPEDPFAPIVIVSQKLDAALDERSEKKWVMVGYSEFRPQKFFELYVELELWKKYVATLPKPKD